jgi:hypothetical protein
MHQWIRVGVILALFVFTSRVQAGGPRLDIVIGNGAPALERFAAQELAGQLKKLFDAQVGISTAVPAHARNVFLLGSPATNTAIKDAMGDHWPRLTDQGHLLRSVWDKDRPTLIVGGGSPIATLWAVYEFGHRFGIRYLLHGDVMPLEPPPLKLDGFDIVLEPTLRTRTWRTINDFAIGPESWGLAEHKRVLAQLAKLKFNRIMLSVYPWQPFVDYEFRGIKKKTATLWYGYRYPVDGDTAGRAAFGGAKEFTNPDFAGKNTYAEKTAAGIGLARGIIDAAHDLRMSTAIALSPLEFPREFAAALPGAKFLHGLQNMTVGPGPLQPPDDPLLRELVVTQIRAFLNTYPRIDALYLTLPEFPDWIEHYERAWQRLDKRTGLGQVVTLRELTESARKRTLIASGDRGVKALQGNIVALDFFHSLLADDKLLRRPDGKKIQVVVTDVDSALFAVLDRVIPAGAATLHFVDYTPRRIAEHSELLARVPARKISSSLILTLADDNVGVLPQSYLGHLHTLVSQLRKHSWEGFSTRYWTIGELDPVVYYLSRAAFDPMVTPKTVFSDLFTPFCGQDASGRLAKAFDLIEKATTLIDKNDIGFTFPVPGMVMRQYRVKSPPPKWWLEVRDLYANAMDEMYRANTRANPRGRPTILYYCKRLEFACELMNSLETARLAGLANSKKNSEQTIENLEKAVESMYNALDAYREVVRDNSDRGVIAVLNEYGYRPLKKEFQAQKKAR